MSGEMDMTEKQKKDMDWLLEEFHERVPGTNSALLLSSDGLKVALHGLDEDQADTLSALVSGMYSLAKEISKVQGAPPGGVRQNVTELDSGFLFIMSAGEGSLLAVLARVDADAGFIGHQMTQLVKSVAEHLVTPARHTDVPADGAGE